MVSKTAIFTTAIVVVVSSVGVVLYLKYRSQKARRRLITLKDPAEKYFLTLIEKKEVSHDTFIFRFALPSNEHILGLPIGLHIFLSAMIEEKLVVRPYTPISSDADAGFVDLMIKVYFSKVNPRFPDGGKMSQHLHHMKIGDGIHFRGPSGNIIYNGKGVFTFLWKKSVLRVQSYNYLSMIAGGTGITPLLQIISAVLSNPNDKTKMSLIFANQSVEDILCRTELDLLAATHSDRFQLWYTVDRANEGWTYSTGFINDTMIQERLFKPSHDNLVLLCGPPPMISFACTPNLDKLAYDPQHRFTF